MAAFAGAVDHAAHDRHTHRGHLGVALAPFRHALAQEALDLLGQALEVVAAGAAAAGAGHDLWRERAQPQALQDFLRHQHLLGARRARLGRERDADGVADALLQQDRERCGGGDDALDAHAGLGEPQVQGVVALGGEVAVDGDQVLHPADLAGEDDAVVAQAQFLGAAGAVQRRFDEGVVVDPFQRQGIVTARVLVQLARQQLLVQRAPVDADAHRLVVAAGELDHLRELLVAPIAATHIAGIDAVLGQGLGAGRMFRQQAVTVEVEVADQRYLQAHGVQPLADLRYRCGCLLGVHRNAHQLGAGTGQVGDLGRGAQGIRGVGVGHRLDGHRGLTADGHRSDAHRHGAMPANRVLVHLPVACVFSSTAFSTTSAMRKPSGGASSWSPGTIQDCARGPSATTLRRSWL